MKIKRTIDGKEYEFELTSQEMSNAWWEEEEKDTRNEADWAFDHYLAPDGNYDSDEPRINGEDGKIPGSAAYRDAWREVFVNSWMMWNDGAWMDYIPKHPLTYYREMTLEDMLPIVKATEAWLDAHPITDREKARKAVMEAYIRHINGEEPIGDISEICEKALAG